MRFANAQGFYELNPFPGCNQIVISNHSLIKKEKRGQGLGTVEHRYRLLHIKELGYDYAICTVKSTNTAQIKILDRAGWTRLDTFNNKETENVVIIYGRVIE